VRRIAGVVIVGTTLIPASAWVVAISLAPNGSSNTASFITHKIRLTA
jgi:hypothetical protein